MPHTEQRKNARQKILETFLNAPAGELRGAYDEKSVELTVARELVREKKIVEVKTEGKTVYFATAFDTHAYPRKDDMGRVTKPDKRMRDWK